MASYLSKPTEYAPYQPTVNAELYGKLLLKKEAEYQAGVEKVNKNLDYVASLPVANEADRKYLQDKVNYIITELNKNTNTDWSDMSVQRTTASHIQSISSDPIIQRAISSAASYKADHQKAKKSAEDNDNKDVANQWYWQKSTQEFLNSDKPGTRYGSPKFINYTDINEGVKNYLKELHPRREVQEVLSKSIYQPDKTKYTVEGIAPSIVQEEVEAYLNTTPGALDQVRINAEYQYQHIDDVTYAAMQKQVNEITVAHYKDQIAQNSINIAATKDPNRKSKLQSQSTSLQTEIDKLDKHDYNQDIEEFRKGGDALKHEIYKKQFIQGIIRKYSYGGKYEVTYEGKLPWEKQMEERRTSIQEANHQLELKKYEDEKDEKAKSEKLISAPKEMTPSDVSSLYANLNKETLESKSNYEGAYINQLGDILQGTPLYKDYFKKVNGVFTLSNPDAKMNLGTDANVTRYQYFVEGYKDKNNNYHRGVLDRWIDVSDDGKDFSVDEEGKVKVKLGNYEKGKLAELRNQRMIMQAHQHVQKIVDDEIAKDSNIKAYNDIIKQLNTTPGIIPLQGGGAIRYTGNQIHNYLNAQNELQSKIRKEYLENQAMSDPEVSYQGLSRSRINEIEKQIYAKYNLSPEFVQAYSTSPEIQKIAKLHQTSVTKYNDVGNNIIKTRGFEYRPQLVKWTKGISEAKSTLDNPSDEEIQRRLQITLDAKGLSWENAFDEGDAQSIVRNKKETPVVSYWWDKSRNKYAVQLSNTSTESKPVMYVTEEVALNTLRIKPSKPSTDPAYQLIQMYNGNTWPDDQSPVYQNAQPLTSVKDKNGNWLYRYHASVKPDGKTVFYVYKTNQNDPKSEAIALEDYVSQYSDWDAAVYDFRTNYKEQK